MKKQYLEIGKIVSMHGVRGEVRVQPWCDSPEYLCAFGMLYFDAGKQPVKVTSRPHKNMVIMKLEGVDKVEDAIPYRGRILFMNREDAPIEEGEFFIQDLIGIQVYDADNPQICYGTLTDVIETGANDVYQVTDATNTNRLIPAIGDVVLEIDLEGQTMKIRPLKGLFEDAD